METFKRQHVRSGPEITERRSDIWPRRKQWPYVRGVYRTAEEETEIYGEKRAKTKMYKGGT